MNLLGRKIGRTILFTLAALVLAASPVRTLGAGHALASPAPATQPTPDWSRGFGLGLICGVAIGVTVLTPAAPLGLAICGATILLDADDAE